MSTRKAEPSDTGTTAPGGQTQPIPRMGGVFADGDSNKDGGDQSAPVAKSSKRRLFGFGRKKDDENDKAKRKEATTVAAGGKESGATLKSPPSPLKAPSGAQVLPSPQRANHPYGAGTGGVASSPQQLPTSSSPGLPSPASSQIFERNVQETSQLAPTSPAIPGHIQTENHIPPVLEASVSAITDGHLNPDQVEIVTHTAHQPAGANVSNAGIEEQSHPQLQQQQGQLPQPTLAQSLMEDSPPHHPMFASGGSAVEHDDTASNYGTLDANDVRRLSFISFADVVQAEHTEHSSNGRDSVYLTGLPSSGHSPPLATTGAASGLGNRSPSPVRSPLSSHSHLHSNVLGGGGGPGVGASHSPPPSTSTSMKGVEASGGSPTGRSSTRGPGSPVSATSVPFSSNTAGAGAGIIGQRSASPAPAPAPGELTIETMSQALRKTGSGDMGAAARSQPMSAVSEDDAIGPRPGSGTAGAERPWP